mgnify:CR=1 FL=1
MEFIVAGYEIIDQEPGLEGMYKAAELPGRICYGSQDKIAEGTAQPFAERLMKSDHGAPLEHGTVYLKAPHVYEYYSNIDIEDNGSPLDKYRHNPYSKYLDNDDYVYGIWSADKCCQWYQPYRCVDAECCCYSHIYPQKVV